MKNLGISITLLLINCSFGGFDKTSGRSRRSLYSFAKIVWHYTGIDSVNFNGHGNYCGVGGEGTIQDPLDLCCKNHDECWGKVKTKFCPFSAYVMYYSWSVENNTVECISTSTCQKECCKCDKMAAECFVENKKYLNSGSNSPTISSTCILAIIIASVAYSKFLLC